MKFQKACLAADPKPHSPKSIFSNKDGILPSIRLTPLSLSTAFEFKLGGGVIYGPPQISRVGGSPCLVYLTVLSNYLLKLYVQKNAVRRKLNNLFGLVCSWVLSVRGTWPYPILPNAGEGSLKHDIQFLCEFLEGNNSSKIYSKGKQSHPKYYWWLSTWK